MGNTFMSRYLVHHSILGILVFKYRWSQTGEVSIIYFLCEKRCGTIALWEIMDVYVE